MSRKAIHNIKRDIEENIEFYDSLAVDPEQEEE